MADAKDIDDSLEFLRYFEKHTQNPDLGALVQEKLSLDKKSLDLRCIKLKENDFHSLADIEPLCRLKALNLDETGLTSSGLKHLVGSRIFSDLETLSLANNNLDDEGIFYLSKSPHLSQLKNLNLTSNEIGMVGARVLFAAAFLGSVRLIDNVAVRPRGA